MFASKDALFAPFSVGYKITKSLRFRANASASMTRTVTTTTDRNNWTLSVWVKRGTLGTKQVLIGAASPTLANNRSEIFFETDDSLNAFFNTGGAVRTDKTTTARFRDPNAWYHVVVSSSGLTGATLNIYVNGIDQTITGTGPSTTVAWNFNNNVSGIVNYIGRYPAAASGYCDMHMAEFYWLDGFTYDPTYFGYFDSRGIWQPKQYTGSIGGVNGFYLPFTDTTSTTTLGNDSSGNGTNWTPSNFSLTNDATYDSMLDSPTNYIDGGNARGNYCMLNPLSTVTTSVLAQANLSTTSVAAQIAIGSIGVTSGKWYWEFAFSAATAAQSVGVYSTSATKATITATTNTIGIKFDADTGALDYTTDGTSYTSISTGLTSGPYFPYIESATNAKILYANFGQRPFAYSVPSGFFAINTQNLPSPTITVPANYLAAVTYPGTGSSQTITASSTNSGNNPNAVTFQPDLVWVKGRSGATNHALYDSVRGVQQQIESDTTTDETTESTGLTAFQTSGFTVGALAQMNTSTATYVAWEWTKGKAQGFDIVTYTGNGAGRTISHSLGGTPNMIIIKARTTAGTDQGWPVYHSSIATPAGSYILLNSNAATVSSATVWNNTAPTSLVFSVGNDALSNTNSDTYVAYLWSSVAGFSAFGSYTGNANADGPFIYTGFRPRYIMIKNVTTGGAGYDWWIYDTSRSTYNPAIIKLLANSSAVEDTAGEDIDILSNGFKIKATAAGINASAANLIYAAFAENPFKYARAR